jgi:hypothetical protein
MLQMEMRLLDTRSYLARGRAAQQTVPHLTLNAGVAS